MKNGEVTFTTDHFSTYGGGATMDLSQFTSPAAWTLKFNDAQVSTFDGSLTWAYDFGLPAGPGGAQPYLGLNYSSRRVDGILDFPTPRKVGPTDQSPEPGYGWELDAGEIAWTGVSGGIDKTNGNVHRVAWRPSWSLRLNGQSLRVVPSAGLINQVNGIWNEYKLWQYRPGTAGNYCGWADGTYYAEDRHDLRIRWVCGDEDGYWEVTTADGAVYRYGTAADSRQRVNAVMAEYGDVNHNQPEPRTIRWRLKEIQFSSSVSAVYTYTTDTTVPPCCLAVAPYEFQTYLTEVTYPGVRVALNWTTGKAPLQNVEIYRLVEDGAAWSRTRRVAFSYTTLASPWVGDGDARRVLTGIQETAPGGAGETALPATTFEYGMYANKSRECVSGYSCTGDDWFRPFYYPRVMTITNGYGGETTAAYETRDSGFWHNYNYRLFWREVSDGMIPANGAHYDYSYSEQRRYLGRNDPYSLTGIDQTSFIAGSPEIPLNCSGCVNKTGGSFAGYLTSTVSAKALPANGGQLLSRTDDQFALNHKAVFGRLLTETLRNASLNVVQQTVNTWSSNAAVCEFNSWRTDGVLEPQHYLSATVQLTRQEVTRDGRTMRTEYAYDGYGNQTSAYEWGFTDVTGDERSTHRGFSVNPDQWIVNKPAYENLYNTITENVGGAEMKTQTHYVYDAHASYAVSPTKGLLTTLMRGGAGGSWATTHGATQWSSPMRRG